MGSKRKAGEKSTSVSTQVTRGAAAARKQEEEMKSSTPAVTASESGAKGKQAIGNNSTGSSSGLKLKINLNPSNPAKKLKTTHPTPPAEQSPSTSLPPPPLPPPLDPKLARRFIPLGPRRTATLGTKDESLLTITCHCASTNTTNELHFRKIPREAINWDDATHITKINAWRNQIFGRAGIKARSVNQWHECEELWLELYFQLSIRKALSSENGENRGIKVPNTCLIRHEFNKVFVGKILFTKDGTALPPRQERLGNAFSSKFARVSVKLKARLQAVLLGKNHASDEGAKEAYMPRITMEMVESYRGMKMRLEEMGIVGVGEEESEYRDDLEAWRWLVGNLPEEEEEEEVEDEQKGEEGKEGEFDDDQATISAVAEDSNSDRDVRMHEANQETSSEDEELSIQEKEEDAIIALWRLSRNPVLHTGFIEFVPEDEYLARPNFPQHYDYDYDYDFEFGSSSSSSSSSSSRDFRYGGVYNTTYRYTNSYMRSTRASL